MRWYTSHIVGPLSTLSSIEIYFIHVTTVLRYWYGKSEGIHDAFEKPVRMGTRGQIWEMHNPVLSIDTKRSPLKENVRTF